MNLVGAEAGRILSAEIEGLIVIRPSQVARGVSDFIGEHLSSSHVLNLDGIKPAADGINAKSD